MSEVTIEQLQAEISELKRDNAALWQAINSIRQKPPLDIARVDRVMQDRFSIRPTVVRR
jgi:FtsZ-binding cell division protein ZapB